MSIKGKGKKKATHGGRVKREQKNKSQQQDFHSAQARAMSLTP
jgi:hypothetical protein